MGGDDQYAYILENGSVGEADPFSNYVCKGGTMKRANILWLAVSYR